MLTKDQIQIRDPFVLRDDSEQLYFLYGSTDKNIWEGPGTGFDVYRSTDLERWEGPFPAFRPESDFWATTNFWAPEVHNYKGKYYMFATFKADGRCRGTQILVADKPLGPFRPHSDGPVTPEHWECLDGTLFVDEEDQPWMVFCHEWVQIHDGTVEAIRLSESLERAIGEPITLFSASKANWVDSLSNHELVQKMNGGAYVTDGPFLHRCKDGTLLMLWSSFKNNAYAQGIAISTSGNITGPWLQMDDPLFESDGGHGMIFRTFEGRVMLALHTPNDTPNERPVFIELEEAGGRLVALRK